MMKYPDHKNRSSDDILNKDVFFDSAGYFYKAASWADDYIRNNNLSSLIYAAVDANKKPGKRRVYYV